jgi:hypothetical protein
VTLTALSPTALSNGSQVQSFGIYSALLILTDYLLVITWFPSCVVIYHDRFESRPNCCCACCGCFHKSDGSCNCGAPSELGCGPTALNTTSSGRRTFDCIFKYKQPSVLKVKGEDKAPSEADLQAAAAETSDATETGAVPRKMEVFFGSTFADFVNGRAGLIILASCVFLIPVLVMMVQISPATKPDQNFPDDHKFQVRSQLESR